MTSPLKPMVLKQRSIAAAQTAPESRNMAAAEITLEATSVQGETGKVSIR